MVDDDDEFLNLYRFSCVSSGAIDKSVKTDWTQCKSRAHESLWLFWLHELLWHQENINDE